MSDFQQSQLQDTTTCVVCTKPLDFVPRLGEYIAHKPCEEAIRRYVKEGMKIARTCIVSNMRQHAMEFLNQREPYTERGNIAAQVLNDAATSIEEEKDGF